MWQAITDILKEEGVAVNQEKTFFVGDAAGRTRDHGAADHSASDRKFALNVGIQFHTPQVRAIASFEGISITFVTGVFSWGGPATVSTQRFPSITY
jgi:hypothetical protein